MTAPLRRAPTPLGTPLTLSLVVVLVLATFGSFATGFGVLQTCTDLNSYPNVEEAPSPTSPPSGTRARPPSPGWSEAGRRRVCC